MTYQVPRQIRDALASLYQEEIDAKRILNDAGLNLVSIKFSASAVNNWHAILEEAQKQNKVESILNEIAREYRSNPAYLCARLAYITSYAMIEKDKALEVYHQLRSWDLYFGQRIENLEHALADLWERLQRDKDYCPLIEYVEHLARLTRISHIAEQLHAWVDFATPLLPSSLTREAIEAIRLELKSQKKSKSNKPNYLSVEIVPDFDDSSRPGLKRYRVEILFWRNNQQEPSWRSEHDPSVSLGEVAGIIDDLLEEHVYEWKNNLLIIEFILPNNLFLQDVNQWKRKDTNLDSARLGVDHPVVIRSWRRLKRLAKRNNLQNWEIKWNYFDNQIKQHTIEQAFWLRSIDEYDPDTLHSILNEETIVPCLGMAFSFSQPNIENDKFFDAILDAGIPVILWLRQCSYADEQYESIKAKIKYLCEDRGLAQLQTQLQKARNRSVRDRTFDLSNHLTLLWDDPTRIPEKYKGKQPLQAPQIR